MRGSGNGGAGSAHYMERCKQWLPGMRVTASTAVTVLTGTALSLLGQRQLLDSTHYSLESVAILSGEVYRLVTYVFFHEDLTSLLCNILILGFFGGSLEKDLGTVKHMFLTFLFPLSTALLYLLLDTLLFGLEGVDHVQGFTPLAFAMMGMSTARSRMKRMILFGINIPTMLMPWLLLFVVLILPGSSFFSNICGILVGKVYGLGFCSLLDFSEPVASAVDKWFFFRFLKRLPGLVYVPGSLAERRAAQTRRINPAPGSYPTQAYYSPSPTAFTQETYPVTNRYGAWQTPNQGYLPAYQPGSHYDPRHSHGYNPHHGYEPRHGYQPRHGYEPRHGYKVGLEVHVNSLNSSVPSPGHHSAPTGSSSTSDMTAAYSTDTLRFSASTSPGTQTPIMYGGYSLDSPQTELFAKGSTRFAMSPSGASGGHGDVTAGQ